MRHLKCVAAINARHQAEKKRLQMAMAPADHVPPARTSTPGRLYEIVQLICSDAAASDVELHVLCCCILCVIFQDARLHAAFSNLHLGVSSFSCICFMTRFAVDFGH